METNDLKIVMNAVAQGLWAVAETNAAMLVVVLQQVPDPQSVISGIEAISSTPKFQGDPLSAAFLQRTLAVLRNTFPER